MSRLPRLSGRDVVKAMNKIGFQFRRQRGSHMIIGLPTHPYTRVIVPNHAELPKGTLRSIIRQAGLTVDEFKALL